MGTTQTTPAIQATEIRVGKSVFDLDSKADVSVVKVGNFIPVSNMQEFVARLGNDAAKILTVINDGLKALAHEELAADAATPWQVETEGENDTVVLEPFAGTLLTEEKTKQLNANVINMAKLLFGYDKNMDPDKLQNRAKKAEAKQKALDMILSNPQVVEALKK